MMKLEIAEGTVELQVKYNGTTYGSGLELKDYPNKESLIKGMHWLSSNLIETLREKHCFAETFDMDGSEHSIGDPDCCGSFSAPCLAHINEISWALPGKEGLGVGAYDKCKGILHYQAVYGGFYHQCDLCGRTK